MIYGHIKNHDANEIFLSKVVIWTKPSIRDIRGLSHSFLHENYYKKTIHLAGPQRMHIHTIDMKC